jgi:tetratricopeptide (TPR) repeat protein
MMRALVFSVMIFCFVGLKANDNATLFTQAVEAYKSNDYTEAIAALLQIEERGQATAEVYYNLGNCYYKLNNVGRSILYYERALLHNPEDDDIIHNLALANLRTTDKITPVPELFFVGWWKALLSYAKPYVWGVVSQSAMWFAFVFFGFYLLLKSGRTFFLTAGLILLLSSFFFLYVRVESKAAFQSPGTAILLSPNSYVKSAPDESGTDLFIIHEGIKLQIIDKVGGWSKIRLADGKVGWVEIAAIGEV